MELRRPKRSKLDLEEPIPDFPEVPETLKYGPKRYDRTQ